MLAVCLRPLTIAQRWPYFLPAQGMISLVD
jgi:hypothetical protein